MLTISDVANRLRVHPATVRRLIDRGQLAAVKSTESGAVRIHEDALDDYVSKAFTNVAPRPPALSAPSTQDGPDGCGCI